jgi:hypothetical protein
MISSHRSAAHAEESLAAFQASWEQQPAAQQLMSAAQQLSTEIISKLPAEVRPGGSRKARSGQA